MLHVRLITIIHMPTAICGLGCHQASNLFLVQFRHRHCLESVPVPHLKGPTNIVLCNRSIKAASRLITHVHEASLWVKRIR